MLRPIANALAATLVAAVSLMILPADARAATIKLVDTTYTIPPSAAAGRPGIGIYATDPLVLTSRGTLSVSLAPSAFGTALQNLSFNLASGTSANLLAHSGSGAWSGSIELDPGTYFGVTSGWTPPRPDRTTSLGFMGLRLEFTPLVAEVPLPAAGGLLSGALALGGALLRRRRRALPVVAVPAAA